MLLIKFIKEIELLIKETDLNVNKIEANLKELKARSNEIAQLDKSIQSALSDDDDLIKDMEESANRNVQIQECIITAEKAIKSISSANINNTSNRQPNDQVN